MELSYWFHMYYEIDVDNKSYFIKC
jgi:hypothetical protein